MLSSRISLLIAVAAVLTSSGLAQATIIEVGDLNIIDDAGNPSDGLRFLDMTYSDGLSLAGALANAAGTYANVRLATTDEWDDLFAAAGVVYSGSETASAAFATGGNGWYTAAADSGAALLRSVLGATEATGRTHIWTDPDGSNAGTRDHATFHETNRVGGFQVALNPPHSSFGWLLVSEVPEPGTLSMVALGVLAIGLRGRRAAVR